MAAARPGDSRACSAARTLWRKLTRPPLPRLFQEGEVETVLLRAVPSRALQLLDTVAKGPAGSTLSLCPPPEPSPVTTRGARGPGGKLPAPGPVP